MIVNSTEQLRNTNTAEDEKADLNPCGEHTGNLACAGTGVHECNSMHAEETAYGKQVIAALDRCLKKSTTSPECKNAMALVDKYTEYSIEATKCAKANRLDDNLLHSRFQLGTVTDKLNELETRSRSERKAIRKASRGNKHGL